MRRRVFLYIVDDNAMSSSAKQGFSLIEIIISVFLIMFTISSVLVVYNKMSYRIEIMRWKRSALRLAQQRMEELMANPNRSYAPKEEVDVLITSPYGIKSIPYGIKSIVEVRQDPNDQKLFEVNVIWKERPNNSLSLKSIVGN